MHYQFEHSGLHARYTYDSDIDDMRTQHSEKPTPVVLGQDAISLLHYHSVEFIILPHVVACRIIQSNS